MKVFFCLTSSGGFTWNLPVFAFSVFDNADKVNVINDSIDIANSFCFVLKFINM